MTEATTSDLSWLEPWAPAGKFAAPLEEELHRELGPQHPFYGVQAMAIARRTDADDVLFKFQGAEWSLAVVHLTWSGHREADARWPTFDSFDDLHDWAERRMMPDHIEFLG